MYHNFIDDSRALYSWPLVRGIVFFLVFDMVVFNTCAIDAKQMSINILIVYNFNIIYCCGLNFNTL